MELNFESGKVSNRCNYDFFPCDYENEDHPEVFSPNEQEVKFSVRVKTNVIDRVVYREEK